MKQLSAGQTRKVLHHMLFSLGQLLEGRGEPLCIATSKTAREAMVLMIENDFSQLPVVDDHGNLVGIVSEQSILRTHFHLGGKVQVLDLPVDHCKTLPITMSPDSDLFEALDRLQDTFAIVVVNDKKSVGILTDFDTTTFFRDLSEGLILIEDIEITIRQYIAVAFPDDSALLAGMMAAFGPDRRDPRRPSKDVERLSMNDYIQLVITESNWPKFQGIFEPKDFFTYLMDKVRDIRNQIAHFRGRMVPVQYDVLQRAAQWLTTRPKLAQPESEEHQTIDGSLIPPVLRRSGGRYGALRDALLGMYKDKDMPFKMAPGFTRITLSIEDISTKILPEPLPPSAWKHRSWWANDSTSHAQSKAWLEVGWRVSEVDFTDGKVTFANIGTQHVDTGEKNASDEWLFGMNFVEAAVED